MKDRRAFLKKAGMIGLALPMISSAIGCKSEIKDSMKSTVVEAVKSGFTLNDFGIQLWTVRDAMAEDAQGTLKLLSAYGYNTIESFQGDKGIFWGMTPSEYQTYLNDHGMKTLSTHCNPQFAFDPKTRDEFKKLVDDAASIGLKYLVNPYIGFVKTKDDFKKAGASFNELGEICKASGLQYCYHNHHYSYQLLDGEYPQDILMRETEGGPVGYEMDVYWVVAAGQDPVTWLKKYPNRYVLSHVKDRYKEDRIKEIEKTEEANPAFGVSASCVLGTGSIDFGHVLQVAKDQGMQQFIVEQERYDGMTSMEAAKADANYMAKFRV